MYQFNNENPIKNPVIFGNRALKALFWLIFFSVFLVPLIMFSGKYAPDINRVVFFSLAVFLGWILWFFSEFFAFRRLSWVKTGFNLGMIFLVMAVFLVFLNSGGNIFLSFISPSGIGAWVSLVFFCFLCCQLKFVKFRFLAIAFFAGFGLFFAWRLVFLFFTFENFSQDFLMPAKALFSANSFEPIARFFEHAPFWKIIFGFGLGNGPRAYFGSYETIDLASVGPYFPEPGGFYARILWDGGILLLACFLFALPIFCVWVFKSSIRILPKTPINSNQRVCAKFTRIFSIIALLWFVFLWFKTFSFLSLFASFIFVLLLAKLFQVALESGEESELSVVFIFPRGSFKLKACRAFFVVLILLFVFSAKAVAFPSSEWLGSDMRAAEAENISNTILLEAENFSLTQERAEPLFSSLISKAESIDFSSLNPELSWRLARSFARAKSVCVYFSFSDCSELDSFSSSAYDFSLKLVPKNLVLIVEAASFYASLGTQQGLSRAFELSDLGARIDPSYIPVRSLRASLFASRGDFEQALKEIEQYVWQDFEIAYSAGNLCSRLGKFEKAAEYYSSALKQNKNHLQARFELAQAFAALGKFSEASAQLDELEKLVSPEDSSSREAISRLRDMIK